MIIFIEESWSNSKALKAYNNRVSLPDTSESVDQLEKLRRLIDTVIVHSKLLQDYLNSSVQNIVAMQREVTLAAITGKRRSDTYQNDGEEDNIEEVINESIAPAQLNIMGPKRDVKKPRTKATGSNSNMQTIQGLNGLIDLCATNQKLHEKDIELNIKLKEHVLESVNNKTSSSADMISLIKF